MLVKIIDCVCSKLCHFHSRGGFPDGSLICNAHFRTLLILAETNPFSLFHYHPHHSHQQTHVYFTNPRTSGPISLFGIFYVMHFFFLRLWKTGTYPKAAKQAITKNIWVQMQSEEKKRKMRKNISK